MSLSIYEAAQDSPDKIGLVFEDREYSFRELAELTTEAVVDLCSDLIPDISTRVAIVGHPDLNTIIRLYALFELRIPAVLIHPKLTETEREQLLAQMGPEIVWEEEPVPCEWASESETPAGCCVIITTSGTSGSPKGVMLSTDNLMASAKASAENLGIEQDDRWLLCMPLAHIGGLSVVTRCLIGRSTVVCLPKSSAENITEAIEEKRVTQASLVPTVLRRILDLTPTWRPPTYLRSVLVGGANTPEPLFTEAVDRGIPVLRTYGLTETASQVCTQRLAVRKGESGCGPALDGIEICVREGMIFVRSDTVMQGYFPSGTYDDPVDRDGWLSTGDYGELDATGCLRVLSRRSDLIISGGENVYPAEIEDALCEIPTVVYACVFGVDDDEWGQVVAAVVMVCSECSADWREIVEQTEKKLASYKHPKLWCSLEELPTNPSGKVDRSAARKAAMPYLKSGAELT